MNKITQHIPSFIYGFENKINEFNSIEELLNIGWIKSFKNMSDFFRFSISTHGNCSNLMAEYDEGYRWWVVGYLQINPDNHDIIIELPNFKPKYK